MNTHFFGPLNTKVKPFFIDTPTEMGSTHPFPHKNLNFQWNIFSGRECNDFYNKNSVYVISQLHLRRLLLDFHQNHKRTDSALLIS